MLRAGANEGATGESAVIYNAAKVDLIVGPISILLPNAMLGELSPRMAEAIASSPAHKILLPLNRSGIEIVGLKSEPLPHLIEELVRRVKEFMV
jgi:hypothetical protein